MAKDPRGEKRSPDGVGVAPEPDPAKRAAAQLGRMGGKKRAENLTPERRIEIAKIAAAKRWGR